MIRYAARRLAVTAPILLLISLATFWAAGKISSPAAQIAVNPRISAEARRAYAESLGLNALIPVTTLAAVDVGLRVGGLIVTERVFQYPGMGLLFLDALNSGDYPILLATVMIVATAVFVMNLAADLLYAVLDPRIRHG